jgi:hypothetical protein
MNLRARLAAGQGRQRLKNEKQRPDLGLKTLAAESIQATENKTEISAAKTNYRKEPAPNLAPEKQKTEQHQTKMQNIVFH